MYHQIITRSAHSVEHSTDLKTITRYVIRQESSSNTTMQTKHSTIGGKSSGSILFV